MLKDILFPLINLISVINIPPVLFFASPYSMLDHENNERTAGRQALYETHEGDFLRTLCGRRGPNQNRSHAREVSLILKIILLTLTLTRDLNQFATHPC